MSAALQLLCVHMESPGGSHPFSVRVHTRYTRTWPLPQRTSFFLFCLLSPHLSESFRIFLTAKVIPRNPISTVIAFVCEPLNFRRRRSTVALGVLLVHCVSFEYTFLLLLLLLRASVYVYSRPSLLTTPLSIPLSSFHYSSPLSSLAGVCGKKWKPPFQIFQGDILSDSREFISYSK